MSGNLRLSRKNALHLIRESAKYGPYDEFPILRPEVDPQLHVSRNDHSQPFYLVFEKDSVLVQFSGVAQVTLRDTSVRYYDLEPGDFVYIPGGVPHRILVNELSLQYRYKAREAGLEAVVFACQVCDAELHRHEWDTADQTPQAGYLEAVKAFNASTPLRTCGACGAAHPAIDLSPYRWGEIAELLSAPEEAEATA